MRHRLRTSQMFMERTHACAQNASHCRAKGSPQHTIATNLTACYKQLLKAISTHQYGSSMPIRTLRMSTDIPREVREQMTGFWESRKSSAVAGDSTFEAEQKCDSGIKTTATNKLPCEISISRMLGNIQIQVTEALKQ